MTYAVEALAIVTPVEATKDDVAAPERVLEPDQ